MGSPNPQETLAVQKLFQTTWRLDRKYLRSVTRYRQTENGATNCDALPRMRTSFGELGLYHALQFFSSFYIFSEYSCMQSTSRCYVIYVYLLIYLLTYVLTISVDNITVAGAMKLWRRWWSGRRTTHFCTSKAISFHWSTKVFPAITGDPEPNCIAAWRSAEESSTITVEGVCRGRDPQN